MALGTIISGVTGGVSIPVASLKFDTGGGDPIAVDARVTRWTMSIARDEHDTTTFAVTNNFRTFVGGMANFTGRCEGFLDSSHFVDVTKLETEDLNPNSTADFTLKASEQGTTDRNYRFRALITSIELGVDKVAHSSFVFTFRGSDVITLDQA